MVTNLALLGHCDNVKPLMSWHESLYNLCRDGVVDDDVLRIAVLDFRSGSILWKSDFEGSIANIDSNDG